MNTVLSRSAIATHAPTRSGVDMKLEVVILPVSDVDRSATFYADLGWRLDADFANGDGRLLQFTPPGSPSSIIFGTGVSSSSPGSARFLFLVVSDIEAARDVLIARGVPASEVFHDRTGGYNFFDPAMRAPGPDPTRRSYASFVTFHDPDANVWLLQEVTTRFPGRVEQGATTFASTADLAEALRRAAAAHGAHETRIGAADANWPAWYATHMAAEQSGEQRPS